MALRNGRDKSFSLDSFLVPVGYFGIGAVILAALSTFQKLIISAPLELRGFIVPLLYGGFVGALVGKWAEKLKRQNRALVARIAERQYLLRDLHHRIQNNLQVVSSLFALDASQGAGSDQTQYRIDLMASLHSVLYDLGADYQVDLSRFLPKYVAEVCRLRCNCDGDRLVDADAVTVPLDTSVVLGMILNELIGSLDSEHCKDGQEPRFELRNSGDSQCCLTIHVPAGGTGSDQIERAESVSTFMTADVPALLAQQISAEISVNYTNDAEIVVSISFCPGTQRNHGDHIIPVSETTPTE